MIKKIRVFLSEQKEAIDGEINFLFVDGFANRICKCINLGLMKFVNFIWNVDYCRNSMFFILAALIVNRVIIEEVPVGINKICWSFNISGKQQGELCGLHDSLDNSFPETFVVYFIYCVIVVFLFWLFRSFKWARFFFFSLLGFSFIKFSSWDTITFLNKKLSTIIHKDLNPDVIFNSINIVQFITTFLLGVLLYLFFRWISTSSGINILPFDDSGLDLKEEKDKFNGRSISELLAAQLHRISHIYNVIEDGKLRLVKSNSSLSRVFREDLKLDLSKGEHLEQSLMQAVAIAGTDKSPLQIVSLLFTIRQLWPWGSTQVITGSIQKYNSGSDLLLKLAARYEQTNHHVDIHAYEVDSESSDIKIPEKISEMVKNLAYRIALDTHSKPLPTSSWEAFKWLNEGIFHFRRYERTQSLNELDASFKCCIEANKKDTNYKTVGDLLVFIGFSYLNRDANDSAKKALDKALEVSPDSPYVQASLGNKYYLLGQYDRALQHYEYAKELKSERPEIYLRIGCTYIVASSSSKNYYSKARANLWYALNLQPNYSAAQSALAWLDFLCHLKELESGQYEKAEISLEKAFNKINRMSQAKKTYIDYSNLAIFYLYKGCEIEANTNWWKAFQLCPSSTPSMSIYDNLHHIFYKLLATSEVDRAIVDLRQLIVNCDFHNKCVIEELLLDAKIILRKCLDLRQLNGEPESVIFDIHDPFTLIHLQISEKNALTDNHHKLAIAMQEFIAILEQHLLQPPDMRFLQ
jgi:Tfp pilus assembly protein PilF